MGHYRMVEIPQLPLAKIDSTSIHSKEGAEAVRDCDFFHPPKHCRLISRGAWSETNDPGTDHGHFAGGPSEAIPQETNGGK